MKLSVNALNNDKEFAKNIDIYTELLLNFNKIHNLTGAKTKKEIYLNIQDSIFPLDYLNFYPKTAIDVGSGAGFPGLILAMALKNTSWHLFEPIAKKTSFLFLAKSELGLKNLEIHTQRVQETNGFNTSLITSRALCETKNLLKYCKNYISNETIVLLYKGSKSKNELQDLENYNIIENGNRKYIFIGNIQ